MEQYQWSVTWWVLRLMTFIEIVVIIYLFWALRHVSKCMIEIHQVIAELIKMSQNYENTQTSVDELNAQLLLTCQKFKRKDYEND